MLLPIIPIQTFIRRLVTKVDISYYCCYDVQLGVNRGPQDGMRWGKYREKQASRTGASCRTSGPYDYWPQVLLDRILMGYAHSLPVNEDS